MFMSKKKRTKHIEANLIKPGQSEDTFSAIPGDNCSKVQLKQGSIVQVNCSDGSTSRPNREGVLYKHNEKARSLVVDYQLTDNCGQVPSPEEESSLCQNHETGGSFEKLR